MPTLNENVVYHVSETIPVKRKSLCEYFISGFFYKDLNNKINAEMSNLNHGSTIHSAVVSYTDYYGQLGEKPFLICNPGNKDTLTGIIEFNINWESRTITNGNKGSKNTKISFKLNIVFIDSNKYEVTLRATTLYREHYKAFMDNTIVKDEYLGDVYQQFLASDKKEKADKELFAKINDMVR